MLEYISNTHPGSFQLYLSLHFLLVETQTQPGESLGTSQFSFELAHCPSHVPALHIHEAFWIHRNTPKLFKTPLDISFLSLSV